LESGRRGGGARARKRCASRVAPSPPNNSLYPASHTACRAEACGDGARTWCGPRRRKGVLLYRRKKAETDGWVPSERRCARTWPGQVGVRKCRKKKTRCAKSLASGVSSAVRGKRGGRGGVKAAARAHRKVCARAASSPPRLLFSLYRNPSRAARERMCAARTLTSRRCSRQTSCARRGPWWWSGWRRRRRYRRQLRRRSCRTLRRRGPYACPPALRRAGRGSR
jgi:hypothetical protein